MPTIVGHQRVLYYTFVTYLVTIAALRIILTAVSWVLSSNTLGLNNPLYSTALNMSLSFAPPVVAFIYWVKNRPSDLTLANIGLSRKNIIQDMICGVVGYMAFLPIMVLTVYVSPFSHMRRRIRRRLFLVGPPSVAPTASRRTVARCKRSVFRDTIAESALRDTRKTTVIV